MYHDAPIRHPSPSSSSAGSDDDHAVFCFCGEEIFPDEEGETSIYCSTVCARQDALQCLLASGATPADASRLGTAASSTTSSSTSISGSYASSSSVLLPSSMVNAPSYASASPLSTKPVSLGPSLFSPGGSENDTYASSAHASDDNDDDEDTSGGGIVDWQASHYRRMERERAQLLERRRRAKEARRHEHQIAVAQFRLQQPVHQQRSSDDRISHNASLSRSNTASSSASSSSRCYISTHPSRARTPELAFHSSTYASSSHGRNDSLASSLSTRSSTNSGWGAAAGGSGGWGAFGLGLAGASPAVVTSSSGGEMMITEEDEEDGGGAVERIRLSASEKGKERERMDAKGMRMSDVLNEILAMEKGFVVPTGSPPRLEPTFDFLPTPAPEAGDTWMTGTPPRLAFYGGADRSSSTPKGRSDFHQSSLSDSSFNLAALAAFPSSGAGQVPPSTPSRSASHGSGTSKLKRSLAVTPPPPPPPPAAPITRRRPSVSGPSHRRAPSNQYHHRRTHSAASASKKARPTMSSPEIDLPMRRSGSPLPPPPDLPSRPRTLVYSSDHRPASSSYRTSSSEGSLDHYSGSASPPRPFLARKAWAGGAAGVPGSESVWSFPSLGSESSLATVQQTQQHPYALAYRLPEAATGNTEQGSIPFPLFDDDDSSPTLPHFVQFDRDSAAAGPLAPPVALVSPSAGVSAAKPAWGEVRESEVVGGIKLEAAANEQSLWTGWPAAGRGMGDEAKSWEIRRG